MRKVALGLGLVGALVAAGQLRAEAPKAPQHRVVVEVTSDDPRAWDGVLGNVENLRKALGDVSVEVVAHGKGLSLLVSSKDASVRGRLEQNARAGVVFAACENTMSRENVKKEDLVPGVRTVDSGVAEVVRKQEAGWPYLRTAP